MNKRLATKKRITWGRVHKVLRQMPAQDKEAVQDLMAFKARYKNGK